uniref:CP-type G domain-containing protein n=1 Tax=Globisporangium ultimum (strain ATCC 200006 / CBS 805.95 / DAOM BR144) TaxID=431595 RepID=K3WUT8_GLOUD
MGRKVEKKASLKLKHRAQAAKTGSLAAKKRAGDALFGAGRKAAEKKQGLSQVLGGAAGASGSQQSLAPPTIKASKQLTAQRLKQKRNELRTMKVANHRNTSTGASSLEELMGAAAQKAGAFEQQQSVKANGDGQHEIEITDSSRRAYMKELRKVVDRADVVLEVLDARDPMGCRTLDMEEAIGNRHGKKIVLVLNKIDLVPPEVLQPWLTYLRTFYPTVAFKASTQNQSNHLSANYGRADKATTETLSGSKAVGSDALMQLLKNYCRNNHIKTAITVGVIGYPNVGKSSVINSLKRSKAASVSSTAGHTKVMQEIHIDSKIKLLDCPGIVFDHTDSNALLLRNCINTETMDDPVGAVQVILSRCEPAQLVQLYNLGPNTKFQDVIEFLVLVASSKGKLGKGGIPDRHAAARIILQDWNRGKIPFFTPPPDQKLNILDSQIVSSFADEFDLDKVLNPTSIFIAEEAAKDSQPQAQPMGAPIGPQCSVEVAPDAAAGSSTMTKMDQVMKTLGDSDSDSDMSDGDDFDDDEDAMNGSNGAMFNIQAPNLQQLQAKFEQDKLNPQTALMARRKAKQWRKLKRRAARQQIGAEEESSFSEQFQSIGFQLPTAFAGTGL